MDPIIGGVVVAQQQLFDEKEQCGGAENHDDEREAAAVERTNTITTTTTATTTTATTETGRTDEPRQQERSKLEPSSSRPSSSSSPSWLTPAVICILGTETAERVAYFGFRVVLVLYFTSALRFDDNAAISYFAYVTCLAFVSPLAGAYLADGPVGRYNTILAFGALYFVGLLLLTAGAYLGGTSTTVTTTATVTGDSSSDNDTTATTLTAQRWLTAVGLFLICMGTGGIKPCVSAFGADQVVAMNEKQQQQVKERGQSGDVDDDDEKIVRGRITRQSDAAQLLHNDNDDDDDDHDHHRHGRQQQEKQNKRERDIATAEQVRAYFAWFYFCINIGAVVSVLLMPYLRSRFGFGAAFALPTAFMGLALILFWSKRNQYVHYNNKQREQDGAASISTMLAVVWWWIRQEIYHQSSSRSKACCGLWRFLARKVAAPSNLPPASSSVRPERQPTKRPQWKGQHTLIPNNDDDDDNDNDNDSKHDGINDSIQKQQQAEWNFAATCTATVSTTQNPLGLAQDNDDAAGTGQCYAASGECNGGELLSSFSAAAARDDDDGVDADLAVDVLRVLRVIPVMAMFPMFWALYDQQGSVWTLQATRMNLHGGLIQPDQLGVLNPIEILIFIPLFDECLYPALSKHCGVHLKEQPLLRMAIGMCLTAIGFTVSGLVETAIEGGEREGSGQISVLWQVIQITIVAVGEIFFSVTAMEFSYACAPARCKALVMALYLLTTAVGDFISGVLYATLFARIDRAAVMHLCALLMLFNVAVFVRVAQRYQQQQQQQQETSSSEEAATDAAAGGRRQLKLEQQQCLGQTPETLSLSSMEGDQEEPNFGLELQIQ